MTITALDVEPIAAELRRRRDYHISQALQALKDNTGLAHIQDRVAALTFSIRETQTQLEAVERIAGEEQHIRGGEWK